MIFPIMGGVISRLTKYILHLCIGDYICKNHGLKKNRPLRTHTLSAFPHATLSYSAPLHSILSLLKPLGLLDRLVVMN